MNVQGTIIAVALTSQPQKAGFPLTFELFDKTLPKKSWVKISQIRTLSTIRLGTKLGRASQKKLKPLWTALMRSLDSSKSVCSRIGSPSLIFFLGAILIARGTFTPTTGAQKRNAASSPAVSTRSLVIQTEPNAIVWIDEIRRGVTDASGKLELKKISAGRHTLRVRASGFKETSAPLLGKRMTVKLVRTTDQAELLFQQAEEAREKAKDDESRQRAAELYWQTLKLRSAFLRHTLDLPAYCLIKTNIRKHLRD